MAHQGQLLDSLLEVSQTLLSEHTLQSSLERVAHLSVRAIDACDSAGVSVVEESDVITAAGSDDFVNEVDAIQYGTGEGPCLQAIRDERAHTIDSMSSDKRWPQFTKVDVQRGVTGCMAHPIIADGVTFGSLNLYSRGTTGFTDEDHESGILLAAEAAGPLAHMRHYVALQEVAQRLAREIESRVPEAVGILMERRKVSREEAERLLADIAANDGGILEKAASNVVDSVLTDRRNRE